MRERTKATIAELHAKVEAYQEREAHFVHEIGKLRKEVDELRSEKEQQLVTTTRAAWPSSKPPRQFSTASIVALECLSPEFVTNFSTHAHPSIVSDDSQACLRLPRNCEATCLTDTMLFEFVKIRRSQLEQDQNQHLRTSQHPDINALLNHQPSGVLSHPDPVSILVSDILLRYSEIDTLPRRVAAFYIMYKMLNVSLRITLLSVMLNVFNPSGRFNAHNKHMT